MPITFKLPRRFSVLGSTLADLTGDGTLESIFIRDSILYIYSGKTMHYKSTSEIGGSLSFLIYDVDSSYLNSQPETISIEVSPVAIDIDRDGILELFSIASKRSSIGALGIAPGIEKSYVNMIDFQNGRFTSHTVSEEEELSIQGLSMIEDRLLLIGTMRTGLNSDDLASHLLSLPYRH